MVELRTDGVAWLTVKAVLIFAKAGLGGRKVGSLSPRFARF